MTWTDQKPSHAETGSLGRRRLHMNCGQLCCLSTNVSGPSLESSAVQCLGDAIWTPGVLTQDNPWRFSMAPSYPKASSSALQQQHIWHTAAQGQENGLHFPSFFKICVYMVPKHWAGCHSQLAVLPYCQDTCFPPPKCSAFSLKSSARQVVSCICRSAYTEDLSSPFLGCD